MLDLDLDLAEPLAAVVIRELTPADVVKPLGSTTPHVAKLRDPHHALARALASGMKDVEASAVTGYSQSRICLLKQDPSFQGLLEHYRQEVNEVYLDLHKRMSLLAGAILSEIQERFEEKPESMPVDQLHGLFRTMAERVIPKAAKGGSLPDESVPLTMDLAKLDGDERAQIRQMIEKRMAPMLESP